LEVLCSHNQSTAIFRLGLPVPSGFVISTDNFAEYLDNGEGINTHMEEQYLTALHTLEQKTHRKFGGRSDDGKQLPLLLSVRAGTAIVVPGYVGCLQLCLIILIKGTE
jgi:pyruvate, orthophosphate dikinase